MGSFEKKEVLNVNYVLKSSHICVFNFLINIMSLFPFLSSSRLFLPSMIVDYVCPISPNLHWNKFVHSFELEGRKRSQQNVYF